MKTFERRRLVDRLKDVVLVLLVLVLVAVSWKVHDVRERAREQGAATSERSLRTWCDVTLVTWKSFWQSANEADWQTYKMIVGEYGEDVRLALRLCVPQRAELERQMSVLESEVASAATPSELTSLRLAASMQFELIDQALKEARLDSKN